MDKVSIDQINKSNLLTVIAYSADAAKAQRIANKFVSVTINRQISKRRAATRETSELLTKRVVELRGQLIDADRRVAAYRKAHGIPSSAAGDYQVEDRKSTRLNSKSLMRHSY